MGEIKPLLDAKVRVTAIARVLGVSCQTLYTYLDALRGAILAVLMCFFKSASATPEPYEQAMRNAATVVLRITLSNSTATTKRAPRKTTVSKADAAFLASLSPWARKLEMLARPLRVKLTKAINQK
jgi:hypothetical protein